MTQQPGPKHPKPKAFLVGLGDGVSDAAKQAGYNVASGTFGSPVLVGSSELVRVPFSHRLPNLPEREIVMIDIAPPPAITIEDAPSADGSIWGTPDGGTLDPRPVAMY